MLRLSLAVVLMSATACFAQADEGLVTAKSASGAGETVRKLTEAIRSRNLTIFAEVDHAAGAQSVGLSLRPTHLVVFGNPRGGTPMMACSQLVGLDLPLKMLVWESADGAVNLSYPRPDAIARRHALGDCAKPAVDAQLGVLGAIAADATRP